VECDQVKKLSTTFSLTLFLHRRTIHIAIRAEYTTVTWFGLQDFMTVFTLVKVLTGISWHLLFFLMPTIGARNIGSILDGTRH
jgi:hypothetical protein